MTSTYALPKTITQIALRILAYVFVLCGVTVALGLVFIDTIARSLLTPALAQLGVELETIQGIQLRTHFTQVERIDFRLADSSQLSQLHDLTIEYNWQELLSGNITNILVQSAHLKPGQANTASLSDSGSSFEALPSAQNLIPLLNDIPFQTLSIASLTLSPYLEAAQLSIENQDNTLRSNIAEQDTALSVNLHWPSISASDAATSLTGSLTLREQQRQALDVAFTLSEQEGQPHFESQFRSQTEHLQALLDHHQLLLLPFIKLQGEFVFTTTLSASDTPARDLAFTFTAPASQPITIDIGENLPIAIDPMQWRNTAELNVKGDIGLSALGLSVSASELAGQLLVTPTGAPATTLSIEIPSVELTCTDAQNCMAQLRSTLRLDNLETATLSAQTVSVFSDFSLDLSPRQTQIVFAQGTRFEASTLQSGDIELLNPNVLVQDTLTLLVTNNGDWQINSDAVDLLIPDLINAEKSTHFAIAAKQFQARNSSANAQAFQLTSDLHIRNIGSDWLTFALRKPEATLQLSLNNTEAELAGTVSVADRELLQLAAQWALPHNNGTLRLIMPELSFDQDQRSFRQLFFRPPFNADLVDGSLQGQATVQIRQDDARNWLVEGPVALNATALSGFFEEVGLINLSADLQGQLAADGQFISAAKQSIRVERVDVGLPIENIVLDYAINTERTQLEIDALEATLFNGKVRSTPFAYDWLADRNQAELIIERLDLARLLDLAAYDAVQATGLLSGTLPVALSGLKPSISAGKLYVEAPGGAIHYSSLGAGGGNAALDFVNQALSNYQYDLMETTVDYQTSGELDLGVKLQGLNPDMNNGQRINLNLNINDNIPALLQSLQSGRSIADAVERALQ